MLKCSALSNAALALTRTRRLLPLYPHRHLCSPLYSIRTTKSALRVQSFSTSTPKHNLQTGSSDNTRSDTTQKNPTQPDKNTTLKMGKKGKKNNVLSEDYLLLPSHTFPSTRPATAAAGSDLQSAPATAVVPIPTTAPIVDTHTHLLTTYQWYRSKYPEGRHDDVFAFVRDVYAGRHVAAIVDVWCEAPVQRNLWRELADAAIPIAIPSNGSDGEAAVAAAVAKEQARKDKWGGVEYYFVLGVHPHEAKSYTDEVERDILEAMQHPRCVGWGEMGLDYHYDNSPREVQRAVFERQLRHAVRLGKPLTVHSREADEDMERILKAEVPRDHKIHIHCFTDSPQFAQNLLDHFPNLCIGITGVITYATNTNTSDVIRNMSSSATTSGLRILLETDAPYMVPSNIYTSLSPEIKSKKLPLCHSAMIPWTAEFIVDVIAGGGGGGGGDAAATAGGWDVQKVMEASRANARLVYGI